MAHFRWFQMNIMFTVMKEKFSAKFVSYYIALWKEPFHLLIHDALHEWFLVKFCVENVKMCPQFKKNILE